MQDKAHRLFLFLGAFFLTNALLAEFVGGKLFSLEKTFGFAPLDVSLFGVKHLGFNLTAGVLMWPFVFLMTDIVNEYYGRRGVRLLSYIAVVMIAYAFFCVFLAIGTEPAEFWTVDPQTGVNLNLAFGTVFGQGLWIIIGSLTAFLVAQLVDVFVFHRLRDATGARMLWLRATGSTVVSQLVDSFVVLFIAFYVPGKMDLNTLLAVATMNYLYKLLVAILLTPLLYPAHTFIDRYLGQELAHQLAERAARGRED